MHKAEKTNTTFVTAEFLSVSQHPERTPSTSASSDENEKDETISPRKLIVPY